MSATNISNPNVYVGRNCSLKTEQILLNLKKFNFVAWSKMYLSLENVCVVSSLIDKNVHIFKWVITNMTLCVYNGDPQGGF